MKPGDRARVLAAALASLLVCVGYASGQTDGRLELLRGLRDSGKPVRIPGITIDRFGVVDGWIFRGDEPSEAQLVELKKLGIRTIVAAKTKIDEKRRGRAEALGMRVFNVPLERRREPRDEDVAAFLRIATDPERLPLYVYCRGGRHRTGALIAVYRVAVNRWTAEAALREMRAYGFYDVLGLHSGFTRYVVKYYRRMQCHKRVGSVKARGPELAKQTRGRSRR